MGHSWKKRVNVYPFGLQHKGYNNQVSANANSVASKFKFGGKELSEELGINTYDFGARNYNPDLGRWFNLDPKADATDLINSSPYSFALNNPITFRDPEGDCPPGVDCVGIILAVKSGYESVKKSFSKKIDKANHIASGMVETFDKADKTTGGNGISNYRKATIYGSRYVKEFGEYFSINDISVLKEGKNLNGSDASTTDYSFAAAALILPISGSKLKGLAGEGLDALTKVFNKTSNQAKHLDAKHINAAVGDILGNPITINGKTYDHLDEVQNALNGVGDQLGNLNKQIEAGTFSGEVLEAAENLRSTLQKQKDEITDVLNRAYKKANE